jgi:hypothetical protein
MDRDFSFNISYREFTAEMMQELISHSLNCSQKIKYDCYKAPLELHSATWFVSSMESDIVDYVGNVKRGICPCAGTRKNSISCFMYSFWVLYFQYDILHWCHCFFIMVISLLLTKLISFTIQGGINSVDIWWTRGVLMNTDESYFSLFFTKYMPQNILFTSFLCGKTWKIYILF